MEYQKLLSKKAAELKPSGIRKFFDIASQIDGIISLGVGEPDFKTPWNIRSKAIKTLERGKTVYTANGGLIELRREISSYLQRRFNVNYHPEDEIVVTVGGSEAIDMCIRSLVNAGDEVIIPEPCFVAYSPIVHLTGGVAVPVTTKASDNFKLTADALKEKITEKTKLLIFPFPNNPTGAVMRRENLEEIAEVLRDTNILVLSDEIYAELTYNKNHVSIAEIDGMKERTILVNGFSKAYSMTGWRLGYACGPSEIISLMTKVHQFAIMCAPTTSQYAAIEALQNCDDDIQDMKDEYNTRRRFIVDSFNKLGLTCFEPEGAFYIFPSIKSTGLSSDSFCEKLLFSKKVAVVPGTAFGDSGEGYIRVSYSYSVKHITQAINRIAEFLIELKEENNE
ncbi:MAG: aminotransferase class I/II-fold pyridoxal phosphate-dependent enzyme [Oscillospiraceae bacterium]